MFVGAALLLIDFFESLPQQGGVLHELPETLHLGAVARLGDVEPSLSNWG